MTSQRQLAANKKNALKSTGPKTTEGRAAVRLNGVKHGLTAATLILPGEEESDFDSLLAGFESEHHPSTPTEEALVRQMTMAQWRLRRLYNVEAAFFTLRLVDLNEDIEDDYDNKLTPIEQLALVAHNDRGKSSTLDNLSRLEARLERSFYKALRELQHFRAPGLSKNEKQTQFQDRPLPPEPSPSTDRMPADPPQEIVEANIPIQVRCAPKSSRNQGLANFCTRHVRISETYTSPRLSTAIL